ncbi:MAG TPA: glycoside hydrolase family 32 protein [Terracidiphilus sp.]|nr:glycoside hydrolase family 32 protein [Terracidiphilus sp.]
MGHDRRSFLKRLGCGTAAQLLLNKDTRLWCLAADEIAQGPFGDPDRDPSRPEYHLLPPHNWMNDPNGPIWWKGKYHLFYQLNPNAAVWGDMHWGHAVSTDMVHWRHEPIALAPTPGGLDSEGCFSGSAAVVDGVPTVVYTGVENAPPNQVTLHDGNNKLRETQLLAIAEDDLLLHWKKQAEPAIATPPAGMKVTGFRDPCPWREADGWYMGVGSGERDKGGCVLLYGSQDFYHWDYLHKLAEGKPNGKQSVNPCDSGEMWECPDFFELDGQHCLLYSTEGKAIWTTGDYDPKKHRYTVSRTGVLDHGAYYAPKSFLAPDDRRILWGWIQETRQEVEFVAAGWAGVMSLPRVLRIGARGQLEMRPAREVQALRGAVEKATLYPDVPYRKLLETIRQELVIPVGFSSGTVSVRLVNDNAKLWELTVDVKGDAIRCGEVNIPLPALPWPKPEVHIFLDASVIETFIGEQEAITSRVYSLNPGETELEIAIIGVKSLEVSRWPLEAISPDRLTT